MKKPISYTALYWEDASVRLTDVSVLGHQISVEQTLTQLWPPGMSQFSVSSTELANFVKQQMDAHAFKSRSVLIALPRHRYFAHKLETEENTPVAYAATAQKWFPLPADDLVWNVDEKQHMLLAISKRWETELVGAFSAQGLHLIAITTMSVEPDIVNAYLERRGVWLTNRQPDRLSVWQQRTKRYSNALAGVSLGLVVAGIVLSSRIDENRSQLAAISHRSHRIPAGTSGHSMKPISVEQILAIWNQVPARCYLTNFSFDAQQNALNLHGRAANYEVVTAFTSAISQLPGIKTIDNQKLSLIDMDHRSIVDFSFTVPL